VADGGGWPGPGPGPDLVDGLRQRRSQLAGRNPLTGYAIKSVGRMIDRIPARRL